MRGKKIQSLEAEKRAEQKLCLEIGRPKLPGGICASQVSVLIGNRIHKYGIEFFKLIIDDSVTDVR